MDRIGKSCFAALVSLGILLAGSSSSLAGERSSSIFKPLWSKFWHRKSNTTAPSLTPEPVTDEKRAVASDQANNAEIKSSEFETIDTERTGAHAQNHRDEAVQAAGMDSVANGSFSLEQLESLALSNNPTVREAAALVEKARGQFQQSGLYPNPVVGYQASEIGNEGKAGQQGLFVSQEFVTGGKLRLSQNVASSDIQRLTWQYQAQLQRVQTDVRLRFFQTLGAQREVQIASQLQQVAEESVRTVETRTKAGESAESDVLQLELDLNQVLITKQNAERKLDAARRRLGYVVGRPDFATVPVVGELDGEFAARSFENEWTRLSQSPVLQAATWQISRASALVRREEAQPISNVDVQAGVQYDNASQFTIANVQVGVPLPIHNRNQGNIRSAVAEYQQACEAQQRLELKLRDQLAEALQSYETAFYQEQQYRTVIIPKSEKNLKLTGEAWNVGEPNRDDGFLKLVIARRSFYEAKLAHVRALTELRNAEVILDGLQLSGSFDAPTE